MLVAGNRFREAVEENLHGLRVSVRHDQRESIVRPRLDGSEDVGEGEALVAKPRRTLAPFPPDMANTALLADPRLVLEEDTDALFCASTD
jgi:hypothetical protein